MFKIKICATIYLTLCVSLCFGTQAGIDELFNSFEEEIKPLTKEQTIPLLEESLPKKMLDTSSNEKLFVKAFRFRGNCAVTSNTLKRLTAPYQNTTITLGKLNELCQDIIRYYLRQGYFLAQAYLPEQTIQDDIVTIAILEGNLGTVSVSGNHTYSTKTLLSYFDRFCGKPVNYNKFTHQMLLIDEMPDIDVSGIFEKGQAPGTADLILDVKEERTTHLHFDYNNFGTLFTARNRLGARFEKTSLFLDGDTFSLYDTTGFNPRDLNVFNTTYNCRLNTYGTNLFLGYLYSRFRVKKSFNPHRPEGRSHVASFALTHPLRRTLTTSIDLKGEFEWSNVKNFTQSMTHSHDHLRTLSCMGTFKHRGNSGHTLFAPGLYLGIPNIFGGSSAHDKEASRIGSGGQYFYLGGELERVQYLPKDIFLVLTGKGQYALNKLPTPEQFYIGGPNTVRGFSQAAALGDSGYTVSAETLFPLLKTSLKNRARLALFIDHGMTYFRGKITPPEHKHVSLSGYGLGLRWYGVHDLNASIDVGFPLTGQKKVDAPSATLYVKVNYAAF